MMKGERLAFDELFKQQSLKQMSSDELADIIGKLQKAKSFAKKEKRLIVSGGNVRRLGSGKKKRSGKRTLIFKK